MGFYVESEKKQDAEFARLAGGGCTILPVSTINRLLDTARWFDAVSYSAIFLALVFGPKVPGSSIFYCCCIWRGWQEFLDSVMSSRVCRTVCGGKMAGG